MSLEAFAGFGFARPVWLLALLPAFALCRLAYQHRQRGSGWESILPAHLQRWLLRRPPSTANRNRHVLLAACWAVAVLALAGPSREVTVPDAPRFQPALLIALDVSDNMLSDDLKPTRLARAKRKIRDILALPEDYQVSLVAYAGSAHRVTPLSDDPATLVSLLQALEPGIMPSSGRDLDQALTLARQSISELPRSTRVLLITSGADETELTALATHAAALGQQLSVLGTGTSEGAPVALEKGGFMRDDTGRILLPRLNARELASTVRRHGGSYHGMTLDGRDLQRLLPSALPAEQLGSGELTTTVKDYGVWLALLLVPLAALGARRGWLGLILLAGLLPSPAQAAWADYWQRPDQQAATLLSRGQPDAAAERFEDPAWRAWAWYEAGDYTRSVEAYAEQLERQPDDAESHFNYGTALAMNGQYQQALEAFEQALTRNPEHHPARHNRDRIEALLEQLKQQADQQAAENTDSTEDPDAGQSQSAAPVQSPAGEMPSETDQQPAQTDPATSNENRPNSPSPAAESGEADSTASGDNTDRADQSASEPANASDAASTIGNMKHDEQQQALDQWLEAIPDEPAELLRRKFLYQYQQRKEAQP